MRQLIGCGSLQKGVGSGGRVAGAAAAAAVASDRQTVARRVADSPTFTSESHIIFDYAVPQVCARGTVEKFIQSMADAERMSSAPKGRLRDHDELLVWRREQ